MYLAWLIPTIRLLLMFFPIMGESPSGEYVLFFPVPEANRRPVDPETPNG